MNVTLGILLFVATALFHSAISLYFTWRFFLHRRIPSLICAFLPVGWVVAVARELHWIHHHIAEYGPMTTVMLALAPLAGLVGCLLIFNFEQQQTHPFL